jgi:y4mF family transcriptional regulator
MIVDTSMQTPPPIVIQTPADLGRAIRARRRELGMQQAEVAMQSGVSAPTVSAIENGKETARIGLVLQLCRDLGLQIRIEG